MGITAPMSTRYVLAQADYYEQFATSQPFFKHYQSSPRNFSSSTNGRSKDQARRSRHWHLLHFNNTWQASITTTAITLELESSKSL